MISDSAPILLLGIMILLFVVVLLFQTLKIIPQANVAIVERPGRFHKTLEGGFHIVVPFIDRTIRVVTLQEHMINIGK